MSRITLRQLEYFVGICETGSMTAASRQIHVSQSAISMALSDLEDALGVQLFIRRARGLTITQSGRQLLSEARRLLASVDDLQNNASDLSNALSGRLAIGCYSTLSIRSEEHTSELQSRFEVVCRLLLGERTKD